MTAPRWSEKVKALLGQYPQEHPASAALDRIEELEAAMRFVELLEPDASERAEILADPQFWATDYAHALNKLAEVMDLDQRAKKAEAHIEELEQENERLKADLAQVERHSDGLIIETQRLQGIEQKNEAAEAELGFTSQGVPGSRRRTMSSEHACDSCGGTGKVYSGHSCKTYGPLSNFHHARECLPFSKACLVCLGAGRISDVMPSGAFRAVPGLRG